MHERTHTHTTWCITRKLKWVKYFMRTSKFHRMWLSSRTSHHFCCCRFWNASTVCTTQELVPWISYHCPNFAHHFLFNTHTLLMFLTQRAPSKPWLYYYIYGCLLHLELWPQEMYSQDTSVSIAAGLHTGWSRVQPWLGGRISLFYETFELALGVYTTPYSMGIRGTLPVA